MDRSGYDLSGWSGTNMYCTFTGTPTLNTAGTALSYRLGPNETIEVELGDVFDETGVWASYADELAAGAEYVTRAYPLAGSGYDAGPWTADLFESCMAAPIFDCIHSQGYWKNHASAWPVTSLTLGTVTYTQAELLSILNTPAKGNGLVFLAHQLIATKLNIENGANVPGNVDTAITDADALIGGLTVPPVGNGYIKPKDASGLTNILDSFNNGTGGGNCAPVPTETVTWGQIKALYSDN